MKIRFSGIAKLSDITPDEKAKVLEGKWYSASRVFVIKTDQSHKIVSLNLFERIICALCKVFGCNYLKQKIEGKSIKVIHNSELKAVVDERLSSEKSPASREVLQERTTPPKSPLPENSFHVTPPKSPLSENSFHVTPPKSPLSENSFHVAPPKSPLSENSFHVTPPKSPLPENSFHVTPPVENDKATSNEILFKNGDRYVGGIVSGSMRGKGVLTFDKDRADEKRDRMEGIFIRKRFAGTCYYRNGGVYKGSCHNGRKHGEGVYTLRNLVKDGVWKNDKFIEGVSTKTIIKDGSEITDVRVYEDRECTRHTRKQSLRDGGYIISWIKDGKLFGPAFHHDADENLVALVVYNDENELSLWMRPAPQKGFFDGQDRLQGIGFVESTEGKTFCGKFVDNLKSGLFVRVEEEKIVEAYRFHEDDCVEHIVAMNGEIDDNGLLSGSGWIVDKDEVRFKSLELNGEKGTFTKGVKNGPFRMSSEETKATGHFKDDVMVGEWQFFDKDKEALSSYVF